MPLFSDFECNISRIWQWHVRVENPVPHTFNCVSLITNCWCHSLEIPQTFLLCSACVSCGVRLVYVCMGGLFSAWCFGEGVFFFRNPSHPAVGPKASQFLAALMGRSGLGKHRSSPLRCGRVVQSSSKGGDWPQVGWLSVIAMETTSTCVVTTSTPIASDSTSASVCV